MHLEVLKHAGADAAATRRSLETIERELGRLGRMLPAAFDVVALERSALSTVSLREAVEEAVREEGRAPVGLDGGTWPAVRADRGLLVLALRHLLRNALEATAAAGSTRAPQVGYAADGEAVTVVVRDWGAGLRSTSPRAAIRLSAPQRPGGVGVGLLTAERVARLHGGEVTFATVEGGGAEVRLTLDAGGR
jgi:signal transduction histidine kinase